MWHVYFLVCSHPYLQPFFFHSLWGSAASLALRRDASSCVGMVRGWMSCLGSTGCPSVSMPKVSGWLVCLALAYLSWPLGGRVKLHVSRWSRRVVENASFLLHWRWGHLSLTYQLEHHGPKKAGCLAHSHRTEADAGVLIPCPELPPVSYPGSLGSIFICLR